MRLLSLLLIFSIIISSAALAQSGAARKDRGFEEFTGDEPFESDTVRVGTQSRTSHFYTRKTQQIPDVPPNNSRISFRETYFDFGNVPEKGRVTHNFTVYNKGIDTLTISRIKAP